jgi:molybdopterin synthase sulfur carrier subunit
VNILYFAWVKEKVGVGEERVEPPAEVRTVSDLMGWLAKRSEGHASAFAERRMIKVAVDQTHVDNASPIAGAREVAFFPPVTGG